MVEENEGFAVDDLKKATWAMRKIVEAEVEVKKVKEVAESEMERISTWVEKETEVQKNTIEYMEALLINYYISNKRANAKFKLSTPYGKVSSRKRQPRLSMNDEKVLQYLRENQKDEMIQIKESYNKTELKKMIKVTELNGKLVVVDENGTLLEFISAEVQEDSYTIKTDESGGIK